MRIQVLDLVKVRIPAWIEQLVPILQLEGMRRILAFRVIERLLESMAIAQLADPDLNQKIVRLLHLRKTFCLLLRRGMQG